MRRLTENKEKLDIDFFLQKLAKNEHTEKEHELFIQHLDQCSKQEYTEILNKWKNVLEDHDIQKTKQPFVHYKIIAIAASLLLVLSLGIFMYTQPVSQNEVEVVAHDVGPGGNKALLMLEDGTKIDLNDAKEGDLALQNGVVIAKTEEGKLVYHSAQTADSAIPQKLTYNTIVTPKGGQFQVVLPDGSKVWLNAESTLRYPVTFTGEERRVELIGEGYFEVESNSKKPFKVASNDQLVTVLGTHFNINAYSDESNMTTTLVEGALQVESVNHSVILKPGEQAIVKEGIQTRKVDTDLWIAWKNGDFIFRNDNIKSIMRQVSRWYNVEVEYVGDDVKSVFGGMVSRSKNLSSVLKMLESTNQVDFEVVKDINSNDEEGRVIVTLK